MRRHQTAAADFDQKKKIEGTKNRKRTKQNKKKPLGEVFGFFFLFFSCPPAAPVRKTETR